MSSGRRNGATFSVVLAAGAGTRLRALERALHGHDRPKQFCVISGERSLLDATLARAGRFSSPTETVVVAAAEHAPLAREQLAPSRGSSWCSSPATSARGPASCCRSRTCSRATRGGLLRETRHRARAPAAARGCLVEHLRHGRARARSLAARPAPPARSRPPPRRLRARLGTAAAGASLAELYRDLPSADFSRDVLSLASGLEVLALPVCGWSDWGTPERVLASFAGTPDHDRLVLALERARRRACSDRAAVMPGA